MSLGKSSTCLEGNLSEIGFMKTFFNKMGLQDLRFKPAYNPYTEVIALSL